MSSESESSSEEEEFIEESTDKDFFRTLSCLKNKDPKIYDAGVEFYTEKKIIEPEKKKDTLYLRDYERKLLTGEGFVNEEMTYVEEQKALKDSFKAALEDDSDDELLTKKVKTETEKTQEEDEYTSWLVGKKAELTDKEVESDLKPLKEFWSKPNLDEGEEFLKNYILNKKWMEPEEEITGVDLSEDEDELEAQEDFEREYNMRNDEGVPKRFPRQMEGSLRRKDDSRKRKREEIKQRKKEEKEKKKKEILLAQKEKLKDIQERLEKLKELTGNETLPFGDEDIMEDFDPEKYDKKMSELYNDEYYSKADEEKPEFEMTRSKKKKERKRKRKKTGPTDLSDVVKPETEDFKKLADEFYSLDCEDFIDDIPTRFKYREVEPNDYGLTIEEILAADDEDLNRWVPTHKIYKQRPAHVEKNEVKIYRDKAKDERLKAKLLPSLYRTEEEQQEVKEEQSDNEETKEEPKKKKRRKRKGNTTQKPATVEISDDRLLAYKIKPKQFRNKQKFVK